MVEYHIKLPVSEAEVRKLRVGDFIYVSGIMVAARDSAHKRALEVLDRGERLPIDLKGLALYHVGPVVKKTEKGWVVVAAGPTTSIRMESYEAEFIEKTGVRIIIGKGGMGRRTAEACKKFGAVYAIFTGGAAALAAAGIKRVVDVHWLDLGTPEAMWVFEAEDFGPLMVAIDSTGHNFYEERDKIVERNLKEKVYPMLGIK